MQEAAEVADKIAIMDHGKIIMVGTVKELLQKTKTKTLEEAFLQLTGNSIRDEEASGAERLRQHRAMWRGR
jgi:ABC-2 type transport system ATP-binding protein